MAHYAVSDPAEVAQARNLIVGGILLFSGRRPALAVIETPSEAWKLGWPARGNYFNERLGGNLPHAFRVIDRFVKGAATSIKSIDLNAATYQDAGRLMSTLSRYINALAEYAGSELGGFRVRAEDITSRTLSIAIPKGSMTSFQRRVIEAARVQARGLGIDLVVTPF